MDAKSKLPGIIKRSAELAGAGAGPLLATAVGDPTGGVLAQAGVAITRGLVDFVQRTMSTREEIRSISAVAVGAERIQERISSGEELRDDDFFRTPIGSIPKAQTILDGVLTKAKLQYEEQKVQVLGELLASVAFDASISADDASWLLSCIDRLTYRHLLILAAFNELGEVWGDNDLHHIVKKDLIISVQIGELRGMSLLNGKHAFAVAVAITPSGKKLVEAAQLSKFLDWDGQYVRKVLNPPDELYSRDQLV
ncbi:hypothetical protein QKY98_05845 [Pseudomonas sp. HR1]|uniref:hypothetical protein n=1 Tax=Pseudomonas sp. HR1 TaxID=1463361 RepID=UPI0025435D7A|nr:hypothetical protein [Pseudomonas sp. HR1]MDK4198641.1 hypothetical protein [Pseudomonas sp. HR1]